MAKAVLSAVLKRRLCNEHHDGDIDRASSRSTRKSDLVYVWVFVLVAGGYVWFKNLQEKMRW